MAASKTKAGYEKQLRKEITKLRQELKDAREGARELSLALDGVMVQVLMSHGQKVGNGYEMRIPAIDIKAHPHRISARVNTEGNEYVITAVPINKGT